MTHTPDLYALATLIAAGTAGAAVLALIARSVARAVARARGRHRDQQRPGRRWSWLAVAFGICLLWLFGSAVFGAVISFETLAHAAEEHLGPRGWGFPLLADAWIAGTTGAYVIRARQNKHRPGWKLGAYVGIGATIGLNIVAATSISDVPWFVWPPAVWALFLELVGADAIASALSERPDDGPLDRIPLRMWLHPIRTARLLLHMAATGIRDRVAAAESLAVTSAAVLTLRHALPLVAGLHALQVRREVIGLVRAGTIDPGALLRITARPAADTPGARQRVDPDTLLRAALAIIARRDAQAGAGRTVSGTVSTVSGGASGGASADTPPASGTVSGTASGASNPPPPDTAGEGLSEADAFIPYFDALNVPEGQTPREMTGAEIAKLRRITEGRNTRVRFRARIRAEYPELATRLAAAGMDQFRPVPADQEETAAA